MTQKIPYARRDFVNAISPFKRWRLYENHEGCTPLLGLEICMGKSPPPLLTAEEIGKPPPVATAIADDPPAGPVEKPTLSGLILHLAKKLQEKDLAKAAALEARKKAADAELAKKAEDFDLHDLPDAMLAAGYPVAAALNKRWLDGRYYEAPLTDNPTKNASASFYDEDMVETGIVKLDWLCRMGSIGYDFDMLTKHRIFNDAAVLYLKTGIFKKFLVNNPGFEGALDAFHHCEGNLQILHRDFQFQVVNVGTYATLSIANVLKAGLTDATAALGSFSFYAAVAKAEIKIILYSTIATMGISESVPVYSVVITHAHVYAKDSYSFADPSRAENSQYLGHWNKSGVIISFSENEVLETGSGAGKDNIFYKVSNSSYRKWQQKHRRGGDFLIFSDLALVKLPQPIVMLIGGRY